MTVLEPHPELRTEPAIDVAESSWAALVADGAEVTRQLAEVPRSRRRVVSIPAQAVAMVDGMSSYGD